MPKNYSIKSFGGLGGAQYEHISASINYHSLSLALDESGNTRTSLYGNLQVQHGEVLKHVEAYDADVTTLMELLEKGKHRSGGGPCLGDINSTRTGVNWLTYTEVLRKSKHLADGFLSLGLQPGPSTKVGIYSGNSSSCLMTELATYRHSMVVVPLYASYGAQVCSFIVGQCEIETVYVDTVARVETILEQLDAFSTLKTIILGKTESSQTDLITDLKQRVKSLLTSLRLLTITEVEALGRENPVPDDHLPTPSDLALICYTSGSMGTPKGVMLSHRNVVADVAGVHWHLGDFKTTPKDTIIGFLPLGHMYERMCEYVILQMGGAVGYASGDPLALVGDLQLVRPTIMPAVPRMLNRVYTRIKETVAESGPVKRAIFALALKAKRAQFSKGSFRSDTFWDRLVFSKIHQLLGGRVRFIPLGSAPVSDAVLEYLRCCLGCQILFGYGTTEVSSDCTIGLFGDLSTGNVGVPVPSCTIKLVDVPEMGYYVTGNDNDKNGFQLGGEILIKGSIVFSGYFKDEEKTKEVLDTEGWYHTGDIAHWNANGTLSIVDRKKDIFKLSQGEYVVPGHLENVYLQNALILQIYLYGDSLKSCVVAVVVPNAELFNPSLAKDELKAYLLSEMVKTGRAAGLKSYEIVKALTVNRKGWTIEDNLLTPTMKNKRFLLRKHFAKEIEQMYEKLK